MVKKTFEVWDRLSDKLSPNQIQELKEITKAQITKQPIFPLNANQTHTALKEFASSFNQWDKEFQKYLITINASYATDLDISKINEAHLKYREIVGFEQNFKDFVNDKTKPGTKIRQDLETRVEKLIDTAIKGGIATQNKLNQINSQRTRIQDQSIELIEKYRAYFDTRAYKIEPKELSIASGPANELGYPMKNLLTILIGIEVLDKTKWAPGHEKIPIWLYLEYRSLPEPLKRAMSFTNKPFILTHYDIYHAPLVLEITAYDSESLMTVKGKYLLSDNENIMRDNLKKLQGKQITISGIISEIIQDPISQIPYSAKMIIHNLKTDELDVIEKIKRIKVSSELLELFEDIDFKFKNPKANKFPHHQDYIAYEIRIPDRDHNYFYITKVDAYDEDTSETTMQHGLYYSYNKQSQITETGNFGQILSKISEFKIVDDYYKNIIEYLYNVHNFIQEGSSNKFTKVYTNSIILSHKIEQTPSVSINLTAYYPKDEAEAKLNKNRFDWDDHNYIPTPEAIELLNMSSTMKGETYVLKDYLKTNYDAKWEQEMWVWTPKNAPTIEYLGQQISTKLQDEQSIIEQQVINGLRPSPYWGIKKSIKDNLILFLIFNDPPVLIPDSNKTDFLIIANFNTSAYYLKFQFPYDARMVSVFQELKRRKNAEYLPESKRWQIKLKDLEANRVKLSGLKKDIDKIFDYLIPMII